MCWLLGGFLSKVHKPGNVTESVVSQFCRSQVQIRVLQGHRECFFPVSFSCSLVPWFRCSLVYGSITSSLCLCLCVTLLPLYLSPSSLPKPLFLFFFLFVFLFLQGHQLYWIKNHPEYDGILITSSESPFPNKATFTSPQPTHPPPLL